MEGLLPFLYRAILHYAAEGGRGNPDSPSASPCYVRLAASGADDSGRLWFAGEVPPVFPSPVSRDARAAPVIA